jgi:kynurenine formamidase
VPLDRLIGPGVVIDVSAACARDADYVLGAADVEAFEAKHGRLARGTIVLMRSGWGAKYEDRKAYFGDDTPGDASKLHFPGVGKEAAELLVARGIDAIGIDTPSIDHGPSKDFIAHQILAAANVPIFENVAALDALPDTGFEIVALPMKIGGGSGGPLRIIARIPR